MAYTQTAWVNGGAPAISAANLGKIESALANSVGLDAISDLRALSIPTAVFAARVMGHTTVGDGGEGVFFWVSGDQSANITADPGGAIWIAPNSSSTGSNGAWKRLHSGFIDAAWTGMKASAADNWTSLNNAIKAGNANSLPVRVRAGDYTFTTTTALTTMTDCPGLIGDDIGNTIFRINTQNNFIVSKGSYKQIGGFQVNNTNTTTPANFAANVRVQNCIRGRFFNFQSNCDAANQAGFCLEHAYDGSADDAWFLVHVGCWYNEVSQVTTNYVNTTAEIGYGIVFQVAPEAKNVTDPPGQPAGTYTGSVSFNTAIGLNIERRGIGLFLVGPCADNKFLGGQWLGCDRQVVGESATSNAFIGTKHNQWVIEPFNFDVASARNAIVFPTLFDTSAAPWSLGTLTGTDMVLHNSDGVQTTLTYRNGVVLRNDATPTLQVGAQTGNGWLTAGRQTIGGVADQTGIVTPESRLRMQAGAAFDVFAGSTSVLEAELDVGLRIPRVAGDPNVGGWGAGQAGYIWFNTSTSQFRGWNGTTTVTLA